MNTVPTDSSGQEKASSDHEEQLIDEVQAYLKEKERVRSILGRVGGTPGKKEKVMNILFLAIVGAVFITGLIFPEQHILTLEVAILLVSLKLALILTQNAKMNHFQFWMLSTIEWRLSELSKNMNQLKKDIDRMEADAPAASGQKTP